jgi:COMPASS component SPP1
MMTSSQSAAADTAPPSSPPTKLYNDTNFKYKYPQARPAPEGIDPVDWNKIYNAADSRIYNKANKSATASKAKREAGETRILALEILKEKHAKLASTGASNMAGGSNSLSSHSPALPMMPKAPAAKKPQPPKEGPLSSREATPATMDMAERIKTEGRPRKAASAVPSDHDTPAPSPLPKIGSTAAQPKAHKPGPKKGPAAPTKKQQDKKSLSKPKANGMFSCDSNPLTLFHFCSDLYLQ